MSGDLRDGSSGGVPYAFHHQVPEEFVRIPEPTESDGWRAAMAKLMPDCTEEELDAAGQGLRDNLPDLHDSENVTLTAMCIGTEEVDGDERLSMGLLAVTVRPSDHVAAQRLPTAEGIYRTTEKKFFSGENPDDLEPLDFPLGKGVKGKQDMLLAAKLPCGPAVMSTSLRTLHVPPLAEGMGRTPLAMASLQLIVPAPDSYCVYVTISTPSVFLLDSYSARLAHIGRTLVFQDPAGPTPAM
ncbi:hypothetical protein [Streptomyces sp. NPDC002851]